MSAPIFAAVPGDLERQLFAEFSEIIRNYREHRWRASELSGGRFCEVVFSIVSGIHEDSSQAAASTRNGRDFRSRCRALESSQQLGKGIRLLVLPLLTILYEIRNNRDVGHIGGEVDSNAIDAFAVVTQASFILAELIRHLTSRSINDAQAIVDKLSEYPSPLIWTDGAYRRVLVSGLGLRREALALLASIDTRTATVTELSKWTGQPNKTYIRRVLRELDGQRLVRFENDAAKLSPKGQEEADQIVTNLADS